ncbi:MAG: class I SAM-dependent methyltransferase [Vibrio sp.]
MPAQPIKIPSIEQPSHSVCPAQMAIPPHLLRPLWLRGQESLHQQGLLYDPIATSACWRCQSYSECRSNQLDREQRLYASLTHVCDQLVRDFLKQYPDAYVINISSGLDTRFYRLDNGRCHWIEVDDEKNLALKQQLFYANERLTLHPGKLNQTQWIAQLGIPVSSPVFILCEQALLECAESEVARFLQRLGYYFPHANACVVLAGDKTKTKLAKHFGSQAYAHGLSHMSSWLAKKLPCHKGIQCYSPVRHQCKRWKSWQHACMKLPWLKYRLTPIVAHIQW